MLCFYYICITGCVNIHCFFVVLSGCFFFFFKQKTAYEIEYGLVGSEMCIRDRDDKMSDACVARADKFSEKVFDKKIREVIERA